MSSQNDKKVLYHWRELLAVSSNSVLKYIKDDSINVLISVDVYSDFGIMGGKVNYKCLWRLQYYVLTDKM